MRLIYLEIVILAIGAIISLIKLFEKSDTNRHGSKKVLAVLYIGLLVTGVVIAIIKKSEKKISSLESQTISSTLSNIDTISGIQLAMIEVMTNKVDSVYSSIDTFLLALGELRLERDVLINEYSELNKSLKLQNNYVRSELILSGPDLNVPTHKIEFDTIGNDRRVYFIVQNKGARIAKDVNVKFLVLYSKEDTITSKLNLEHYLYSSATNSGVLYPYDQGEKPFHEYWSDFLIIKDVENLAFVILTCNIEYVDPLNGEMKSYKNSFLWNTAKGRENKFTFFDYQSYPLVQAYVEKNSIDIKLD